MIPASDNSMPTMTVHTLYRLLHLIEYVKFLKDNDDFELIKEETIINDIGDCFYYGLIKRV